MSFSIARNAARGLRIGVQGRLTRHHDFDGEPGFGDFQCFGVGDRAYACAAVGQAHHQPVLAQHRQRGADMRAVDREAFSQFGLDQPLVRQKLAARDRLAQLLGDVVGLEGEAKSLNAP